MWDDRIKIATEKGMEPLVEPTLKRWFTEPMVAQRPPVLDTRRAMIRAHSASRATPAAATRFRRSTLTHRLKEIACPMQVIVGEQDVGTPVAMSQEIRDATPGSELVIIPKRIALIESGAACSIQSRRARLLAPRRLRRFSGLECAGGAVVQRT